MKSKRAMEIVGDLMSSLYHEIEQETIREHLFFQLVPSKRDVQIEFMGVDLEVLRTDSLLTRCKDEMMSSDDPRNQIELAEGFESLAKWLRKDAARLSSS